jgi:hypothetical protein
MESNNYTERANRNLQRMIHYYRNTGVTINPQLLPIRTLAQTGPNTILGPHEIPRHFLLQTELERDALFWSLGRFREEVTENHVKRSG